MIQRTVIESERSSIDHQLATGVGNLAAQYGSILGQATTALQQVPHSEELQKAIVENAGAATRKADASRVVKQASADGVQITVEQGKTLLTPAADDGSQTIGDRIVKTSPPTTVTVYISTSTLISRLQQADSKVYARSRDGEPAAARRGGHDLAAKPSARTAVPHRSAEDARYRAAIRRIADSKAVALYPQRKPRLLRALGPPARRRS